MEVACGKLFISWPERGIELCPVILFKVEDLTRGPIS